MKKIIRCKKCDSVSDIYYQCDTCGRNNWLPNLTLIIDLEEYHFCKLECAIDFLNKELKKESN